MRQDRARKEPDWPLFDEANKKETESLWENGTWELTDYKPGMHVIDADMLGERQRGSTGEFTLRKGRCVARGDRQVYPRGYADMWAPVVWHATLRLMLATAATRKMSIR